MKKRYVPLVGWMCGVAAVCSSAFGQTFQYEMVPLAGASAIDNDPALPMPRMNRSGAVAWAHAGGQGARWDPPYSSPPTLTGQASTVGYGINDTGAFCGDGSVWPTGGGWFWNGSFQWVLQTPWNPYVNADDVDNDGTVACIDTSDNGGWVTFVSDGSVRQDLPETGYDSVGHQTQLRMNRPPAHNPPYKHVIVSSLVYLDPFDSSHSIEHAFAWTSVLPWRQGGGTEDPIELGTYPYEVTRASDVSDAGIVAGCWWSPYCTTCSWFRPGVWVPNPLGGYYPFNAIDDCDAMALAIQPSGSGYIVGSAYASSLGHQGDPYGAVLWADSQRVNLSAAVVRAPTCLNRDVWLDLAMGIDDAGDILVVGPHDSFANTSVYVLRPITGPNEAPTLVSAVSRKTHGAAGTFDIPLPLSGTPGVECRNGDELQIILTFSEHIRYCGAQAEQIFPYPSEILELENATCTNAIFSGCQITATISCSDETCVRILVKNTVTDTYGTPVAGDTDVQFARLCADINGDGAVLAEDVALVSDQIGQAADADNFRCDLDSSGQIDVGDLAIALANFDPICPHRVDCIGDPPPAPVASEAFSRKLHTGIKFPPPGTFSETCDLPLTLASDGSGTQATVEPRNGGPTTIVVKYDQPIGGTIALSELTNASQDGDPVIDNSTWPTEGFSTLTLHLTSVVKKRCISFLIEGVAHACDSSVLAADRRIKVKYILGDVTGGGGVYPEQLPDGRCEAQDVNFITIHTSGLNVNPKWDKTPNFRLDLDLNGSIGATDVILAATNTFVNIPPCNCTY